MNPICRCGCGEEIPPGRKSYAGPRCHGRWRHKLHKCHQVRAVVFAREGGVCQICGCDTMKLRTEYIKKLILAFPDHLPRMMDLLHPEMRPLGFPELRCSWWQADHEDPLIEGGSTSTDNCRTACVPCHKIENGRLAARRSEKRRAGDTLELPLCL